MHLFAQLLFNDLEESRNNLVSLFEKLTPQQWKRKIPGGEHDVHALANHILSDSQRLAMLAPIVGMDDLFPNPTNEDRYACVWKNERVTLSPENILAKGRYERNKLRTLIAFVSDRKQARLLYESDFKTGWHERMHIFDIQQALLVAFKQITVTEGIQVFVDKFTETIDIMPLLYDIDTRKIDELSQNNKTYRQELALLASKNFFDINLPKLKGNATAIQIIQRIHQIHNHMIENVSLFTDSKLKEIIDGKPFEKRLMKIARDFAEKAMLFKTINLRDSWALEADL